jgi:hypothetical protein
MCRLTLNPHLQLQSVANLNELADLTPRFLDSSLHMFFTRFIPIFPVLHRSTFVFRDFSAPLLLNAIALGSLFLGTEDAIAKVEDSRLTTRRS